MPEQWGEGYPKGLVFRTLDPKSRKAKKTLDPRALNPKSSTLNP